MSLAIPQQHGHIAYLNHANSSTWERLGKHAKPAKVYARRFQQPSANAYESAASIRLILLTKDCAMSVMNKMVASR